MDGHKYSWTTGENVFLPRFVEDFLKSPELGQLLGHYAKMLEPCGVRDIDIRIRIDSGYYRVRLRAFLDGHYVSNTGSVLMADDVCSDELGAAVNQCLRNIERMLTTYMVMWRDEGGRALILHTAREFPGLDDFKTKRDNFFKFNEDCADCRTDFLLAYGIEGVQRSLDLKLSVERSVKEMFTKPVFNREKDD